MKPAIFVLLPVHENGKKVIVNSKLIIYRIQIYILSLHKEVDFFLCQHHLHLIGLNAAGIGKEIDILEIRGCVPDKAEIELAHGTVVIMQLRDNDLVDKLKAYTGRKALLGTE